MAQKGYNYNFDSNNNKKKISMNPWAMLVVMLILTGLNVFFTIVTKTVDFFTIAAFVACAAGIIMSIVNIVKEKKQ